jgi:hypothetical protein
MRRAALFLGLVVLAGCAKDEDPTPAELLVGAWAIRINEDCGAGYLFGADGEYEQRLGCYGDGSSFNLEIYGGAWEADGERIRLTPLGGTCPTEHAGGADVPHSFRYALQDDGDTLRTTSPDGALLYQRLEDDGMPSEGGAVYTFGCFTPDGFQPRVFERW